MEAYGKILLIAMPAFLLLVLFEKWYGWYKGNDTVRGMDMLSSISSVLPMLPKMYSDSALSSLAIAGS